MCRLRDAGDPVDTVIVHPEDGWLKAVAQELLALAEHPRDVEYVMWPKPGFRVPVDLFNTWESLTRPDVERGLPAMFGDPELREQRNQVLSGESVASMIAEVLAANTTGVAPTFVELTPEQVAEMPQFVAVQDEPTAPVKRKPGRPKKNTEGQ